LSRARDEWRIESGSLVLQRRVDERLTERFHATRLALVRTEDSDGDDWYELQARCDTPAEQSASAATPSERANRRRIVRRMHDDSVPRRLGLWLARRTHIPLDDQTTPAAREAEIAALRARLEASGRIGRLTLRILDGLQALGKSDPR